MMASLQGRRVIVSGGASGIGRATVLVLAGHGARVGVLDVDDDMAASLVPPEGPDGGEIRFFHADVSDEAEVAQGITEATSWLGGLDVVVAAAGIMRGQMAPIVEFEAATWDSVIDVNLKGAFLVSKHAARFMLEAGSGVIVLVGSKSGSVVGSGSYAYGASKGGIHGLTLALERHLGPAGIRINEVCPADVDTPLYRRSLREGVTHGADAAAAETRLQHLTTPEQVADVLAFLASDAAAAVRGTVFTA